MTRVTDIPRAHTPAGGWKGEMPSPVLARCVDDIAPGVPDLRGHWRAVDVSVNGVRPAPTHPMWAHTERIEQAGHRVVITSGGVVHDFPVVDGSFENGCHDVAAIDFVTPIVIAASFEDGVMVLRPQGMDGIEVRRHRDGDHLVWNYVGGLSVRMERADQR